MPRIRTIKPEFWADEKMSSLTPIDRLVFLGLIGMADDYGRLHDNEKVIDAFIFPDTADSVRESLANLSRIGRIKRGNASSGKKVIEIVNWTKHQKVDKPQKHLCLPPIAGEGHEDSQKTAENVEDLQIRESFANHSRTTRELVATLPGTMDQGSGTMDQGSFGIDEASTPSDTPGESSEKRTSVQRKPPSVAEVRQYMADQGFPNDAEAFVDFYSANGWVQGRGKPIKDWQAAVRNWQRNSFASSGTPPPAKGRPANVETLRRLKPAGVKNGVSAAS